VAPAATSPCTIISQVLPQLTAAASWLQAHEFFPARRLLVLLVLCPTCVQIQLHTSRFAVAVLIFIAMLANVCVFLLCGAARILGPACSGRPPLGAASGDLSKPIAAFLGESAV
jgi:hypothetical protein